VNVESRLTQCVFNQLFETSFRHDCEDGENELVMWCLESCWRLN
jgi:hypothetical protein